MEDREFYTGPEAAEYLGIHYRQFKRIIQRGEIEPIECGRDYIYLSTELAEFKAKYYADGLMVKDIAEFNGISYEAANSRLRKYRIVHSGTDRRRRGYSEARVYDYDTLVKFSDIMGLEIPDLP